MSSNRPELVSLRECLEDHQDNENLLYLTDSEATLQGINKWIGGGSKIRLTRSPDGDDDNYHHQTTEKSSIGRNNPTDQGEDPSRRLTNRGVRHSCRNGKAERGQRKDMVYPNGPNNLPMFGTIQDQERDSYYQNVSMDPGCPESNATESRGNTSF